MTLTYSILKALSDGCFHSGEALARQLSVTRAAVWKGMQTLQTTYSLDIHSVQGRGYRLANTIELLDRNVILSNMNHGPQLAGLETFLTIDSTNHYLLHAENAAIQAPWVVLAEHQTAGRGRRGRQWQSPLAGNIYASMLWRLNQLSASFAGLSLVVGVVISRLLMRLGIEQIGLKWPNDVLCQGKKLCGILIEMRGETHGPYDVVIGVGVNFSMPANVASAIEQPWIALEQVISPLPARNALAAHLLDDLFEALTEFEAHGLQAFLADWRRLDQYRDQAVVLQIGEQRVQGVERGVDEHGALLVEHDGKIQRYYSGEISLRGQ